MKLKNSKNIIYFNDNSIIIFRTFIKNKLIPLNNIQFNLFQNKKFNKNFSKICYFNFSRNNKNLDNMKFEVFKNKETDIKTKTSIRGDNTHQGLKKIKSQSHLESKTTTEKTNKSDLKFSDKLKDSNKFKNNTHLNSHTHSQNLLNSQHIISSNLRKTTKIENNHQNDTNEMEMESLNKQKINKPKSPFLLRKSDNNTQSREYIMIDEIEKKENKLSEITQINYIKKNNNNTENEDDIQNQGILEIDNLNESELEYLEQKDKLKFSINEDSEFLYSTTTGRNEESLQESDNLLLSHEHQNIENDYLDEANISDEEKPDFSKVSNIMNLYKNDPFYKNSFEDLNMVNICEMRIDALFWFKSLTSLQCFSTTFIMSQLFFHGFSLPCIIFVFLNSYLMMKFCRKFTFMAASKVNADPSSMYVDIFRINIFGKEYSKKYSMFQLVRINDMRDFYGYEFHKEDLLPAFYQVQKFSKINNENFFNNLFLINSKNNDNEFLFKYFHITYTFNNRDFNQTCIENNYSQDFIFKTIIKDFYQNFPNYNNFYKEKVNKYSPYNPEYERSAIICIYILVTCGILFFHYLIYKYAICVYFQEVHGGIEKLKLRK